VDAVAQEITLLDGGKMSAKDQIQGYFAFTDEDLSANKNGEFSERQMKKYPEARGGTPWWVLILGLIFLGLTVWRGYVIITSQEHPSGWIWVAVLMFVAIWLFRAFFKREDPVIAKAEGVVKFNQTVSQTGSVTDMEIDRTTIHDYEMWVGFTRFSHASPVLSKYMEGDTYTVYYISPTLTVLSVEKSP
jgi:hypothetical protein